MRILAVGFLLLLSACSGQDRCAAVSCVPPLPSHTINITVTDARGTLLTATPAIANLLVPAAAAIVAMSCSQPRPVDALDAGTREPTCFIDTSGHVVGHYEFDIVATGYKTQHLTADVAATPPSTGCCPVGPYVPADVAVALSP